MLDPHGAPHAPASVPAPKLPSSDDLARVGAAFCRGVREAPEGTRTVVVVSTFDFRNGATYVRVAHELGGGS